MSELHLRLDAERITLDDMIHFETKQQSWAWIAGLLARMARDEHGVPLPHDDAMALVRQLTITEANQAMQSLLESVAVPKATDSES